MTVRAVIYTRESVDADYERRGVKRHRAMCAAIIEERGWTLVDEYEDNYRSASKRSVRRAQYDRMEQDFRAGRFDALVCYDLDRLTRQPRQLEDWIEWAEEYGLKLVTANGEADLTTDGGRLYARVKAAVARGEIERKGQRQRDAWTVRAREGGKTPGIRPFGYEADQMTVRESEAELIRAAVRDVLAGMSIGSVARRWNEAGVKTARSQALRKEGANVDTSWDSTSVRLVLVNPRISGRRAHNGEIVGEAKWPAIVSVNDQEALIALVRSRRPANQKFGGPVAKNLLSGIMRCGACDRVMRVSTAKGKRIYKCGGSGCTSGPQGELDRYVEALVREFLSDPSSADLMTPDQGDEIEDLRKEKSNIEARLLGLANGFADGILTHEQMVAGTTTLRERLNAVESRLGAFTANHALDGLAGVANVDRVWGDLSIERKRAVVAWLLELKLGVRDRLNPTPAVERIEWSWKHEKPRGDQTEA